ncbi:MAG TPA: fasciclin domain-containing protein [Chitinophagales bacterium]|nr:fasciclin domain-containing protein [Chitinophagales bacterium]
MKRYFVFLMLTTAIASWISCQNNNENAQPSGDQNIRAESNSAGQSAVDDNVSTPNVVKVAASSKDHTTLVTAIKAAELVDALSNAGPFTVFAPTNDAFAKLPAGTVDNLLKPEKKSDLQNILQYHVFVGVVDTSQITDNKVLNMVNGDNVTLHVKDGKRMVNDANIMASIRASNGIIYVIDGVLLPPEKK